MKLALGTAQFGLPYGVTNYKQYIPDDSELSSILDYAYDCGIRTIDTATAYGNANERLGAYLKNRKKKFNIINKFSPPPKNSIEVFETLKKKLIGEQQQLSPDGFECLMLHAAPKKNCTAVKNFIHLLKEKGICKKFGLSIYDEEEYHSTTNTGINIGTLQGPYNLLNQNVFRGPFLNQLKKDKCEIHVRSIFLQGLLLNNNKLPKGLTALSPYIEKLKKLQNKLGESMLTICILFLLSQDFVSKIVIGVLSQRELQEIIFHYQRAKNLIEQGISISFSNFNCKEQKLVDPRYWTGK